MKQPGFLKRGEPVRLQSFLARSGVASRRAAEEMIVHGRIAVNGTTVTAMGLQVVPGVDRVEVDGEEVKVAPTMWLALHKPTGYVTSRTDPFGRETVYALLPDKYHGLFHVGRLDRDSEGLLLLTNDGDLANRFLHPSFGITKEYDVIVTGKPSDAVLRQLVEGVELEDGVARAESAKLIGPAGNGQSRLKMVLREGKKREVRRMLAEVGHEVMRLVRRRFGPVDLAELPLGKWRIVAPEELAQVREPARAPRASARAEGGDEAATPRATRTPARAAHNAYGGEAGKRHAKPAGKGKAADASRTRTSAGGDAADRPRARTARDEADRPRTRTAAGGDADRPGRTARDKADRPRAGRGADERKPARAVAKPARPHWDEGEAPPRKRPGTGPAGPARGRFADPDERPARPRAGEEAKRPRNRFEEDEPRPRNRFEEEDRPPRGRERDAERPAPRGKPGARPAGPPPRGKPGARPAGPARGRFADQEERAARPRAGAGDEAKRPRNRFV